MNFWFRKNKIVYLKEAGSRSRETLLTVFSMTAVAIVIFWAVNWIRG